jgi:hypothetical protein
MFPSPALSAPGRPLHVGSWRVGPVAWTALLAVTGCGGAPVSAPAAPEPLGNPKDGTPSADEAAYDKVKGKDPTNLKALFEKGAAPAFPIATMSEQDCWRSVAVVGSARQDYETILKQCGASTGAVQYVRPAMGHLHHKQQRRDTFVVPIQGGLCYRFFGVGDASINDLDILIEQRGALVGDDKTNGPVAIIESDKAWCMDRDGVYDFLVQVHGEGQGHYIFGIWARKDTK